MNVISTQFTLSNKSFEIYLSGCNGNPHCKGCHNPESWNFEQGDLFTEQTFCKWQEKINDFDNLIQNVMIFGGEPLDQNIDEFLEMIVLLKRLNKKIWLFTRYEYKEVAKILGLNIGLFNYIKCGRYIEELRTEDNIQYGIKLATSNQKIYQIK